MNRVDLDQALTGLRDAYPALAREDREQWSARVSAYHRKLRRFDPDIVDSACDCAPDEFPSSFPTAGQLVGLAKRIETTRLEEARKQAEAAARKRGDEENRARVMELRKTVIPNTARDQERWIAEGKSPFVRIARRWEVESKNGNHDPNTPSPPGVGERRMAEFKALIEEENAFVWDGTEDAKNQKPEPGWDG